MHPSITTTTMFLFFLTLSILIQDGRLNAFSAPNTSSLNPAVSRQRMQETEEPPQQQEERDAKVQEVLELARKYGPIGADQPEEIQKDLLNLARTLKPYSDPSPAEQALQGTHYLIYSAAKGGSSGKIGWLAGKVNQNFSVNNDNGMTFVNTVDFGSWLSISLQANRELTASDVNKVNFEETRIRLFGNTVVDKDLRPENRSGTWKYLFLGTITDTDGTKKLVRIMETPSLFVIEQPLSG